MYKSLRTVLVGVLALMMTVSPATAFWFGHCGGYYSSWYGGGYYYRPVVYYSYPYSSCWQPRVVYHDDCCCGVVVEHTAPAEAQPQLEMQPTQPSRVNRPAEDMTRPVLPEETTRPVLPEEPVRPGPGAMDTRPTMPPERQPVESTTPPVETTLPLEEMFREMIPTGTDENSTEPTPGAEMGPAGTTPAAGDGTPAEAGGATSETVPTTPVEDEENGPTTPVLPRGLFDDLQDMFPTEDDGETPAGGQPGSDNGAATTPRSVSRDAYAAVLREEGGLESDRLRLWVDNTGRHSTRARLIQFLEGHVRLLKENGRTTTVPLYRLSKADLEFVHRQASAQRATRIKQTVQTEVVFPVAAN